MSESEGTRRSPEVTSIDVLLRVLMPDGEERERLTTYDLRGGEVPPDLRSFSRKPNAANSTPADPPPAAGVDPSTERDPLSSVETRAVLSVAETPRRVRPTEATSSLAAGGAELARLPDHRGDEGELPVFPAGTKLGTFEIHSTLGQGGMGVVYKAWDASLDRHVALKVLSPELNRNRNFIERFRREAKACGKLSHPNITHIYSISPRQEQFHYFAMEYVEGRNLSEWVRDEGPLTPERVIEIARQAAAGLEVAASGKIIHRDIKPSNLLLTSDGRVKITDFGLAKARASIGHTLDLTSTGVVMGTPLYMSPEQGRGGHVDHRSDMYSLGATLYFLLTGSPPFEADSAIAIILKHINEPVIFGPEVEIPEGIRTLIRKLLEKDATRRPETYAELQEDLERIARGEAPASDEARRVIVIARDKHPTGRTPRPGGAKTKSGIFSSSGLKATKLSVARTNIKLGRRGKAVGLLLETIEEGEPHLRAEAALLLMALYEKEGDEQAVRQMAETIVAQPHDEIDASTLGYASWQLARHEERAAQAARGPRPLPGDPGRPARGLPAQRDRRADSPPPGAAPRDRPRGRLDPGRAGSVSSPRAARPSRFAPRLDPAKIQECLP